MCQTCGLPNFNYETVPLARTGFSTRLIKLHPARTFTADIVLDLVVNDDPEADFEAVSWCWGRDKWNRLLRIRGDSGDRCLRAPDNLEIALRRLRLVDRYRVLWLDAVCIDQVNTVEKNRQVPMMAEIYGKAKRVCVWLGEGDEMSSKAIRFIQNDLLDLQKFDQLCRDDAYGDQWIALIQFMEQPWVSYSLVAYSLESQPQHSPYTAHSLVDAGLSKKSPSLTKKPPSWYVDKTPSTGHLSQWRLCSSIGHCRDR